MLMVILENLKKIFSPRPGPIANQPLRAKNRGSDLLAPRFGPSSQGGSWEYYRIHT